MAVLEGQQRDEDLPRGTTRGAGAPRRLALGRARRGGGARGAVGLGKDDAPVHPGLPADPDRAAASSSTAR